MIAPSGMDAVTARIASIQARIDAFAGPSARAGVPVIGATSTSSASPAGSPLSVLAPDAGAGAGAAGSSLPLPGAQRAGQLPPGDGPTSASAASLASRLPEQGRPLAEAIDRAARDAGIEPALLAAVVRHESNFDQSVVSHAGAIGLAQLMPGTADWLGVDPHDPHQNLAGGARYLREQLDRFGSVELALAAYNAGPNRVSQAGGIPRIAETQAYVPRVVATWQELR